MKLIKYLDKMTITVWSVKNGGVMFFAIILVLCVCYLFPGKSIAKQPSTAKTKETNTNWFSKLKGSIEATELEQQALQLYQQGRYAEAIPLIKKALTIKKNVLGADHPDVATSLYILATLYNSLGRYSEAEPLFKQALTISEKTLGPEHPHVASILNNLAMLYYLQGAYTKVEPLLKRSLAISKRIHGPRHPDVAQGLNNLAELYRALGNLDKAESLHQEALAIREQTLRPEHPGMAESLNNLGGIYYSRGKYVKAEALFTRSLAIAEKTLGPEHPDVAQTLNNLAGTYSLLGDYTKAEAMFKKALVIREKILGPEHPDVAQAINNLAVTYSFLGDYAKAEAMFKRALAIHIKSFGPEHPAVALSLTNLARLYQAIGEYPKALSFYRKALTTQEKSLGPEHPDMTPILNNLAEFHYSFGEYAKAESLYKQTLAIVEKALGSEHPHAATILNNLAVLYTSLGKYNKADSLLKKSLAIQEKILGPKHPDVAQTLNNLAELYKSIGDYSRAETFYKKALTIEEKSLGPQHPKVATILNNLAVIYSFLEKYRGAEAFYQKALTISEKAFGPEHPHVATSLSNLALLYHSHGEYAKAEPLYQRSLTIREQAFGPEHPAVALSLNNLGGLYESLGKPAKAESLYQQAVGIRERIFGLEHPDMAQSLSNLAGLYAALNNFAKAYKLYKQVQEIDEKLIEQVMGFTSEKQKLEFLVMKKAALEVFLSLISQHFAQSSSARKNALNIWLRRKGVILETQRRFQEALIYSDEPKAAATFQELSRVRAQLSGIVFAGPGQEKQEDYKKRVAKLETRKEELEAILSRLSQRYALKQKIAKADTKKIANALPANTALIEFARVGMADFKLKGLKSAHYLAFILHAGNGEQVGFLDLGRANTIDWVIAKFKHQITRRKMDERNLRTLTEASEQVYNLVFAPLQAELGEIKEIFISPDGNLNLIPFEVLLGPDGKFLIENYTFNYLAAGRDILGFGGLKEQGSKALLMGDPDFDMDFSPSPIPSHQGRGTENSPPLVGGVGGGGFRSPDMRGFHFKRLPWTKTEVETIQTLLGENQAALYTGKDALEEVLMQSESPKILHLATHGFFLQDQDWQVFAQEAFSRRAVISLKPAGSQDTSWTPSVSLPSGKFENPLLRSGIALAGANKAAGEEGHTSGIVTAEKILGLKLRGTEMVVLSACETGLGDVQAGEGVFGLRRAFTQAGAKSLVMSLWPVPDKETQELMVQFYQNILSGAMNRSQALHQALLYQMQTVKDRYGYPHPLYWGAFLFMGEPDTPDTPVRYPQKILPQSDSRVEAPKIPSDTTAVKKGASEGWTIWTEGDVQFLMPPNWKGIRQPAEGVLVQLTPESSLGETCFSYLSKHTTPSLGKVSPQERQAIWREFAGRIQQLLEQQGLHVALRREKVMTINTYKALELEYNVTNSLGIDGFSRGILLMTPEIYYGFMGMSVGESHAEAQSIFETIIQSITICE